MLFLAMLAMQEMDVDVLDRLQLPYTTMGCQNTPRDVVFVEVAYGEDQNVFNITTVNGKKVVLENSISGARQHELQDGFSLKLRPKDLGLTELTLNIQEAKQVVGTFANSEGKTYTCERVPDFTENHK